MTDADRTPTTTPNVPSAAAGPGATTPVWMAILVSRLRRNAIKGAAALTFSVAISTGLSIWVLPGQGRAPSLLAVCLGSGVSASLAMSGRLRLEALIFARFARKAGVEMLALVGALTLASVSLRSSLSLPSRLTMLEGLGQVHDELPFLLTSIAVVWLVITMIRISAGTFPGAAARREAIFDRRSTARHEAAHGLVAHVLGFEVETAWVGRNFEGNWRRRGYISLAAPCGHLPATETINILIRKYAVLIAGEIGAYPEQDLLQIKNGLCGWDDGAKASELAALATWLAPGIDLNAEIMVPVLTELNTGRWHSAIKEGARVLLAADGATVDGSIFAEISERHGLSLPAVAALLAKSRITDADTRTNEVTAS